jgi:antiviral helicase SKI2
MRDAVNQLNTLAQEWVQAEQSHVPEVDWGRMRRLEFQETLRCRDALAQGIQTIPCLSCPDFETHVCRFLIYPSCF